MDRSAAEACIAREIEPTLALLGIAHWHVTVQFGPLDLDPAFGTKARVRIYPDYNEALIEIDPEAFADEENLLASLRHELFHIVLAPFDVLFYAVKPALESKAVLLASLQTVRTHATEQAVINLERLYRNLAANRPQPEKTRGIPLMNGRHARTSQPPTTNKAAQKPAASAGAKAKGKGGKKGGKKGGAGCGMKGS